MGAVSYTPVSAPQRRPRWRRERRRACSQVIAAGRLTDEIALIELEWERQGGADQPGMRVTIGDKVVRLARF